MKMIQESTGAELEKLSLGGQETGKSLSTLKSSFDVLKKKVKKSLDWREIIGIRE